MTETTATDAPKKSATTPTQTQVADVLMRLIVTLLAPMFLPATGGNIGFARMAACETINQYNPRNHVDLIAIAQIIACSLTALSSASLAVTDNLSLSMTLRLRANAAALNRVVEQARRALRETRPEIQEPEPALIFNAAQAQYEEDVLAQVAAAQIRTAEALARFQIAEPPATPAPVSPAPIPATTAVRPVTNAPATTTPATTTPATTAPTQTEQEIKDRQLQAMWASAMTDVAQEFTADLKNLPPAEREMASRRAFILSSTADQLLSGDVPPRLRPGALDLHRPAGRTNEHETSHPAGPPSQPLDRLAPHQAKEAGAG